MSTVGHAVIPSCAGPVYASVRVPGSKSLTNRALVCAALARGTSTLQGASDSTDTAMLVNGLNQLGVLARSSGDTLVVEGTGGVLFAPRFPIPVGNAGTTFRFLCSVAALAQGTTRFELSPRMAERPLDDLIEALGQGGSPVTRDAGGTMVSVRGGGFAGGTIHVRGDRSSQFLSSLLLAAPEAAGPVDIVVDGALSSAPYVQMTLQVMNAFGVTVRQDDPSTFHIDAPAVYRPAAFPVEADASSATYPCAVAAILGGSVEVGGVHQDSLQADARFLGVLGRMGCTVVGTPDGVRVERKGRLTGIDVDMNMMPDAVPSLVAVALFAEGTTHIRNVGHLRFKESNRIETLAGELRKLGAVITAHDDGMEIRPAPLRGAMLSSHDDHRLAMSFGVIGTQVEGIRIQQPECVAKSFPRFWEMLGTLCGTPVSLPAGT